MRITSLAIMMSLAACSTSSLPAGAVCDQTADCDDGLTCEELGQFSGATCTVPGKVCTVTCTDDTGCAALGADFKCFATCGADKICGEVAAP